MSVHQVAVYLHEEFPNQFGAEDSTEWTYAQARYLLIKLGFNFGRIHPTLKTGRHTKVAWLKAYCQRRVDALAEQSLFVVDAFLDEAWLYQGESGKYSWFLDNRTWAKGTHVANKWGCLVVIYAWWDYDADGNKVRRACIAEENISAWLCRALKKDEKEPDFADRCGNLTGADFEAFVRSVCEDAKVRFPTRRIRFHYDNASFHKRKNYDVVNLQAASKEQLVSWLVLNKDAASGIGEYDSFCDANGKITTTVAELKALVQGQRRFCRFKVGVIVREVGLEIGGVLSEIDHTAPMWPQCQPCELLFNNWKWDYRTWPTLQKTKDVGKAMHTFFQQVSEEECLKFVGHTDQFCRDIVNRNPHLDTLILELL